MAANVQRAHVLLLPVLNLPCSQCAFVEDEQEHSLPSRPPIVSNCRQSTDVHRRVAAQSVSVAPFGGHVAARARHCGQCARTDLTGFGPKRFRLEKFQSETFGEPALADLQIILGSAALCPCAVLHAGIALFAIIIIRAICQSILDAYLDHWSRPI